MILIGEVEHTDLALTTPVDFDMDPVPFGGVGWTGAMAWVIGSVPRRLLSARSSVDLTMYVLHHLVTRGRRYRDGFDVKLIDMRPLRNGTRCLALPCVSLPEGPCAWPFAGLFPKAAVLPPSCPFCIFVVVLQHLLPESVRLSASCAPSPMRPAVTTRKLLKLARYEQLSCAEDEHSSIRRF